MEAERILEAWSRWGDVEVSASSEGDRWRILLEPDDEGRDVLEVLSPVAERLCGLQLPGVAGLTSWSRGERDVVSASFERVEGGEGLRERAGGLPLGRRLWEVPRALLTLSLIQEGLHLLLGSQGLELDVPLLDAGAILLDAQGRVRWCLAEGLWGWRPVPQEAGGFEAALVKRLSVLMEELLGQEASEALMLEQLGLEASDALPERLRSLLVEGQAFDPSARPSLEAWQVGVLHHLGSAASPEWLHRSLDGLASWLRDRAFEGSLIDAALVFTVRPDAATTALLQDYLWGHFQEELLRPLRGGGVLTPLHSGVLRLLPVAAPALAEVLGDAELPLWSRASAARVLGEQGTRASAEALTRALNDPQVEVAQAARRALEAAPDSPPVAWSPRHQALVPCSVAWEEMRGAGPQDEVKTCTRCEHAVVRVESLDQLRVLAGSSCAAFTSLEAVTVHLHGGPALVLEVADSLLLGSSAQADLYLSWAPPLAARLTVLSHDRVELVALDPAFEALMGGVGRYELGRGAAQGYGAQLVGGSVHPLHLGVQSSGRVELMPWLVPDMPPPMMHPPLAGAPMPPPSPWVNEPPPPHPPLAGAPMPPPPPRLPLLEPPQAPDPEPDGLLARLGRLFKR